MNVGIRSNLFLLKLLICDEKSENKKQQYNKKCML